MQKTGNYWQSLRASRVAVTIVLTVILGACASTRTVSELSQDPWYEARTENFIVMAPYGPERAEELARHLEEFRRVVIEFADVEIFSDPLPFRVIATYGGTAFRTLVGRADIFGAFDQTYEGGLSIVNMAARAPDGTEDLEVTYTLFGPIYREKVNVRSVGLDGVFHEYIHYLLAIDQRRRYPLWFNEGFAEYLSTFDLKGRQTARIGKPPMHRVRALEDADLMPLGALLNSTGYETGHGSSDFYAQAWLFVHYLMSDPDRRVQLYRFLDALEERNIDAQPVFESVFDITAEEMDSRLRRYRRVDRYESEAIELAPAFEPKIAVREMKSGEVKAVLAQALLIFTADLDSAEAMLKEALSLDPTNVRARTTLATLFFYRDRFEEAKKLAGSAPEEVALQSRILSLRAQIAVREAIRLYDAEDPDWPDRLAEGRAIYAEAIERNPREAEAYSGLARTFLLVDGREVPARAYAALDRAKALLPTDFSLELVRGYLLSKEGRLEEALESFHYIIAWSRTPDLVSRAREMVDWIEQSMRDDPSGDPSAEIGSVESGS